MGGWWACVVALLFVVSLVGAEDYYVSVSEGVDNSNCTETSPCLSIEQAVEQGEGASSLVIFLAAGVYSTSSNVRVAYPSVPVTLQRWGAASLGPVTIQGTSLDDNCLTVTSSLSLSGLEVVGCRNAILSNPQDPSAALTIHSSRLSGDDYAILSLKGNLSVIDSIIEAKLFAKDEGSPSGFLLERSYFKGRHKLTFALTNSSLDVIGCSFNTSGLDSMEAFTIEGGIVSFTDSFFRRQGTAGGVAINFTGGKSLVLMNVTIESYATGIWAVSNLIRVEESHFSANLAALSVTPSNLVVSNCTFNGAKAPLDLRGVIDSFAITDSQFNNCGPIAYRDAPSTVRMLGYLTRCDFYRVIEGAVMIAEGFWEVTIAQTNVHSVVSSVPNGLLFITANEFSVITLVNCSLNGSVGPGSALVVQNVGIVDVSNSRFTNNVALQGAAIDAVRVQSFNLSESFFENNRASNVGGSVRVSISAGMDIHNCSFLNGGADVDGGALFITPLNYQLMYLTTSQFSGINSTNVAISGCHGTLFIDDLLFDSIETLAFTCQEALEEGCDLTVQYDDPLSLAVQGSTLPATTLGDCINVYQSPDKFPYIVVIVCSIVGFILVALLIAIVCFLCFQCQVKRQYEEIHDL